MIIVPIVISVSDLIAKSIDQHLKTLSLGCWVKGRIQKAVMVGSESEQIPHSGTLNARGLGPWPPVVESAFNIFKHDFCFMKHCYY